MDRLDSTLTGEQLFADILQLEYDAEHETQLVQRRGLRCVSFKRDGRLVRRFLPGDVAEWLAVESGKRNGRLADAEPNAK